ncbi:hypothetical protein ACIBF5_12800 [Micromonospora sp. NPDC050417]|uniref:hypothetical protein n=1 Tax=Micromonospora sp. NPDC050417 TaxID=3364280 RepID=UPI00378B3816
MIRSLVVALVLVVFALSSGGALDATKSGARLLAKSGSVRQTDPKFEALRAAFRQGVPAGTRMFNGQESETADGLWRHQRVMELAVIYDVVVVDNRSRADVVVTTVDDENAPDGSGFRLVVERV